MIIAHLSQPHYFLCDTIHLFDVVVARIIVAMQISLNLVILLFIAHETQAMSVILYLAFPAFHKEISCTNYLCVFPLFLCCNSLKANNDFLSFISSIAFSNF